MRKIYFRNRNCKIQFFSIIFFLAYLVYMGDYLPFNGRFASLFAGAIVGVFVGVGEGGSGRKPENGSRKRSSTAKAMKCVM